MGRRRRRRKKERLARDVSSGPIFKKKKKRINNRAPSYRWPDGRPANQHKRVRTLEVGRVRQEHRRVMGDGRVKGGPKGKGLSSLS